MSNRKKQKKIRIETNNIKDETACNIDEETLTRVFTNALLEYDKQKEKLLQEKAQKEQEAYEKHLGIEEGKHNFRATFRLIFWPKKYAKNIHTNALLTKTLLKGFYKVIEWVLLLFSVFLIAYIPLQFIIPNMPIAEWYIDVIFIVWTMPLFLLSRIFRIASIEVEHIKDYNYLFGLFAAITSIISVVIAIIAIFK